LARALGAACAALLVLAGCGGSEGVADDATVAVYVAAPLCGEARAEVGEGAAAADAVQVRAVCLAPVDRARQLDLAQVGANARRATEDSAAVAYVEQAGPAGRFSRPIVAAAGIAFVAARSGREAMARVIEAVDASGGERAAVADAFGQ
jgi:hypothetical protein